MTCCQVNRAFCFPIWQGEKNTETKCNPVAPHGPAGHPPPSAHGAPAAAPGLPVEGLVLSSSDDVTSAIFICLCADRSLMSACCQVVGIHSQPSRTLPPQSWRPRGWGQNPSRCTESNAPSDPRRLRGRRFGIL